MWVVVFTERVVSVCAAVLIAAYGEYHLWYVTPDIIAFDIALGMGISVALE